MENEIRIMPVDEGMTLVLKAMEQQMLEQQRLKKEQEEQERRRIMNVILTYCDEAIKRAVNNAVKNLSVFDMKADLYDGLELSEVPEEVKDILKKSDWILEPNDHGGVQIRPTEEKIQEYDEKIKECARTYLM